MKEFPLIAKTFQGLEEVLAQELTELGANDIQIGRRMVSFTGDKAMMYRANFCLRTAVRILKPIATFEAHDADEVYEAVKRLAWEDYLDVRTTFAIDTTIFGEAFPHSKFVAYRVKDAICDRFNEREGKRPSISVSAPDVKLNIHIADTQCTLSLDSSGESLHQRGYRVATVEAPINEVLAAGILKLSGWTPDKPLTDPFCGSGTIVVEAALMARGINPGIYRKSFGFEKWKDFDADLLESIYNDDSGEREFEGKIVAADISKPALDAARANAKSAGVADLIAFRQQDFREFTQPEGDAGYIVTNPPYGVRLTPPAILDLYAAIGERLKHEFRGGDAWIICSKEECFDAVGLRPSIKIQLQNSNLECELRKYQIFEGRMGDFRAAGGDVKSREERRFMNDRSRFRQHTEEFRRPRYSDEAEDDSEEARAYALLRGKHREFMQFQEARERRERREREGSDRNKREARAGDARPSRERRGGGDRKPFRRDGEGRYGKKGFKKH